MEKNIDFEKLSNIFIEKYKIFQKAPNNQI